MKRNSAESEKIHALLKDVKIIPEIFENWIVGNREEMAGLLHLLCGYLSNRAPNHLFRLRKFDEKTVGALEKDRLYFSRADWFNDPYDCLLYFDEKKLRRQITDHISDRNLRSYIRRSGMRFPIGSIFKNEEDMMQMLVTYREGFIEGISKKMPLIVEMLQKSTYITCFAESICSPVMWAHYADNHKSFAIEYNFEPDYFFPSPFFPGDDNFDGYGWRSLLPVHYSKYRVDGTELADWYCLCEVYKKLEAVGKSIDCSIFLPDMLMKTKICLHKAETWSYEKEWRLIITHEWPNEFGSPSVHVEKKASGIYLGDRMDEEQKQTLICIAADKEIPVYEMYIDHSSREYIMQYHQIQ